MSTEELMRPRYKVIADYFYNPYKIGDIITVMYPDRSVHLTTTRYRDEFGEMVDQHNYFHPNELNNLPHLFKKLEWYEERKLDEMPEYVKWDYNPRTDNEDVKGLVEKVINWVQNGHGVVISDSMVISSCYWLPATLAEYEQYINQKEKQ